MIADFLRRAPEAPAWRALVENIAGVSPLLAREAVYRAGDDSESPAFDLSGEIVHREFSALVADVAAGRWSPCVVPPARRRVRSFRRLPGPAPG